MWVQNSIKLSLPNMRVTIKPFSSFNAVLEHRALAPADEYYSGFSDWNY